MARRLERLVPALSVRERFLVALREYKADTKITVRTGDLSSPQLKEYQDYARLVVALNNNLGTYVDVYANQAGFIERNLKSQIESLDNAASILEEELGIAREQVSWRTLRSKSDVSVPGYLRGLSFQLATRLLVEVDGLWQGLRAIEIVWSEAEVELGEDPVHPTVRQRLETAKRMLSETRSRLSARRKPPEPRAELLESARELVRTAARLQILQDDI